MTPSRGLGRPLPGSPSIRPERLPELRLSPGFRSSGRKAIAALHPEEGWLVSIRSISAARWGRSGRKAVWARIRDTIRRIGVVAPTLALHLDRSFQTGLERTYQPAPADGPTRWIIDAQESSEAARAHSYPEGQHQ